MTKQQESVEGFPGGSTRKQHALLRRGNMTLKTLHRLTAWMVAIWAVLLCAPRAFAAGTLPAPGDYVVDPAGSAVAFNVTNLVVTSVDGKFHTFSGHVAIGDSLATAHVEATVDVQSIDTGSNRRDEHLRSGDFLGAAQFPRMMFTSTSLWGTPESFGMKGNLTIKGVTKEVVFAGRIVDTGLIVAEAKIDRTDFGITSGPSIKNEVRLRLQIKLAKASP